jgi:hypothetical protein
MTIKRVHVDTKLEKVMAVLRNGCRRKRLIARRVERIIAEFKQGRLPSSEMHPLTHNGENRLAGCLKYDLGAGYRLITLKKGSALYLLFAGSHDSCDRWIKHHRSGLNLETVRDDGTAITRPATQPPRPAESSIEPVQSSEEDWIQTLSDKDLRSIFSGLAGD